MAIPQTFYEWHQCITKDYGIELTPEFIEQRLKILENNTHAETIRFIELYGEEHLYMTISWFKEVGNLIYS